jgi:hypothetical protein
MAATISMICLPTNRSSDSEAAHMAGNPRHGCRRPSHRHPGASAKSTQRLEPLRLFLLSTSHPPTTPVSTSTQTVMPSVLAVGRLPQYWAYPRGDCQSQGPGVPPVPAMAIWASTKTCILTPGQLQMARGQSHHCQHKGRSQILQRNTRPTDRNRPSLSST